MRKLNVFFFLLLGAMVSFTSCSSDDDVTPLTPEEQEAKDKQELIQKASDNFEMIVSKKWMIDTFNPSSEFTKAVEAEDTEAVTLSNSHTLSPSMGMILSFTETEGEYQTSVAIPEEGLDAKLLEYQGVISDFPAEWGLVFSKKELLAGMKRLLVGPFAQDDKTSPSDIADDATGLSLVKVMKSDLSELSYEDAVLASRKLIDGNSDKLYFDETGKLVIEVTHSKLGTSNWILSEVTE